MAIYHLTTKSVSRSKGQSAIASAAYRSGEKIENERTGEIADYTRKKEVDYKEIIGFDGSRSELWNKAEQAEKRKDATLAKEYEVALPKELNREQKIELAREFGRYLHERHKVAVDVCIHKIDSDNPHAHILTTTREVKTGNELGDKAQREWNDTKRKAHGLAGRKNDLLEAREQWEGFANLALERAQQTARIDHRSLKNQGIEREPQIHVGATATAMERKGIQTERGEINRSRLNLAKLRAEISQVHTQRAKLGVQNRLEKAQEHAHAEKVKALPDTVRDLEKLREWEIAKAYHVDLQRVNRVQERLNRLVRQVERSLREHGRHKPLEPDGVFKAFRQRSYERQLSVWEAQTLMYRERLAQLQRRQHAVTEWDKRARIASVKAVDASFPELGLKLKAKREERAEKIQRQLSEKRKQNAHKKSRGFSR